MPVEAFLQELAPEIDDLEEEYFSVFSEDIPSQNLGGVDPRAQSIDLTINGRDLTIHQSPSILNSSRAGGTTGAVVWKVTPFFASWITSPENKLFKSGVLSSDSSVLELGCGISGIIGLSLGPLVASYTLTDQSYVLKLLNQNLEENKTGVVSASKSRKAGSKSKKGTSTPEERASNIGFSTLDWETDEVSSLLTDSTKSYDVVIACDCIYNDALIPPLVQTCVDVCKLRPADGDNNEPTICIVGQQRRSSEVFEDWLIAFHKAFRTWRVPDEALTEQLRSGSGYMVHIGILR